MRFGFAMLRDMTPTKRSILFSVQESPRFTRELWQAFKDTAARRGELWIDALRRLVEQYVNEHPR